MVFLDFEASSLSNGFPIEVGYCRVAADRSYHLGAKLIHFAGWRENQTRWDPDAEAHIHHISRSQLAAEGEHPAQVMGWLNAALAGLVGCCDSAMDRQWLQQLSGAAGMPPMFGLVDITAAFEGPEISESAYEAALRRAPCVNSKAHRAGPDAEHLAVRYLTSLKPGAAVQGLFVEGAGYMRRPL